jgi:hypothetical protein
MLECWGRPSAGIASLLTPALYSDPNMSGDLGE